MLIASAIAIALPLGAALGWKYINATPVVNIPAPAKAPKPNGYDLYVAAGTALVPALTPVDAVNDSTPPATAQLRAGQYSLARKTAWLSRNRKTFDLFNQAMKTPSLAPPERSLFSVNFPAYAKLRELARAKTVESNARWMRGDYNGALQSGLDTVQMGHDMRRGGVIITTLVATSVGAIGRSVTHDTIDKLDAKSARDGARRLEKLLATRWGLAQTLTEDKYYTQSNWLETFKTGDWRTESMGADISTLSPWQRFRVYTISKQRIMDNIAASCDRDIANASLPYAVARKPLQIANDPFASLYQSPDIRPLDARDLAGDQLLMLRLALRAYQLETGAPPSTLNALTPRYLNAIPADPFGGGQLWRYQRKGSAYRLWSIGPDGVDNGGQPVPPRTGGRPAWPGERVRLPRIAPDSVGDYVAGRNE